MPGTKTLLHQSRNSKLPDNGFRSSAGDSTADAVKGFIRRCSHSCNSDPFFNLGSEARVMDWVNYIRCGGCGEVGTAPSPLPAPRGRGWEAPLDGAATMTKDKNNDTGSRIKSGMTEKGKAGACRVAPPHDEVLLFRQKDPKPLAPGRGPPGAFAPVPKVRAAELAALRQSSPPTRLRDRGAATPAGAMLGQARRPVPTKDNDAGFLLPQE